MGTAKSRCSFSVSAILLLISFSGISQQINTDSIFQVARDFAHKKEYSKSIDLVKSLLESDKKNDEYSLYLSRLYYWSNNLDTAYQTVSSIIINNPYNEEAVDLAISIAIASLKYETTNRLSTEAMKTFPNNAEYFRLKKIIALQHTAQNEEALTQIDSIPRKSKLYPDAQYIKSQILKKQNHLISASYLNTSFDDPDFPQWHLAHIEYVHKLPKNAYVGRVSYGYFGGLSGFQAEVDAYPVLSKTSYLYLNAGVSDGKSLFPIFRTGATFYKNFAVLNSALGMRYLHFENESVVISHGNIAVNLGNYQLGYQAHIAFTSGNWLPTHIVNFRKSFETIESFIQLDLQYGALPYFFFVSDEFTRITAYRVGINSKFKLWDNIFLQPILMYEWEEFVPDTYRNRYNAQLILSRRF